MIRALLAAVFVSGAFCATLYYSGDYLQAWESPEPTAQAAPAPRKKAKRKHSARKRSAPAPIKRALKAPAQPAWLVELNTLCRQAQARAAAIPPPLTEAGLVDYFSQIERLSRRWNRQAAAVLRTTGNPKAARLISLFGEEERLLSATMSALERHRLEDFERLRPQFLAVAKSENRLLKGLGARDCTISEDPFDSPS